MNSFDIKNKVRELQTLAWNINGTKWRTAFNAGEYEKCNKITEELANMDTAFFALLNTLDKGLGC
jgi:hypothetical protein